MDTNKTPEEELAEAQAAFEEAKRKLKVARQRVEGSSSPIDSVGTEDAVSPINEEPAQPFGASAYAATGTQASSYATNNAQAYSNAANASQATAPNAPQNSTTQQYAQSFYGSKDHVAAGLLAIFLGWLGLHKFYLGYNTQGFIMLGVSVIGGLVTFTLAVWVIWVIAFIEGIIYLSKNQTEFDQIYVKGTREWF